MDRDGASLPRASEVPANQVVEECASTNDLARLLAEAGAPEGTWISARRQTGGRGRHGREWRSPEGNLHLSMVARPADPASWSWIPLAAAVAAARALEPLARGRALRIKWPNDLLLDRAKLAGILCEGVGGGASSFVVIGVGINCERAPEGLDRPVAALGAPADAVRQPLVNELRRELVRLAALGPEPLAREYEARAAFGRGSRVRWSSGSGVVLGLGPEGALRVKPDEGVGETSLFAEEISGIAERD